MYAENSVQAWHTTLNSQASLHQQQQLLQLQEEGEEDVPRTSCNCGITSVCPTDLGFVCESDESLLCFVSSNKAMATYVGNEINHRLN